MGLKIGFVIHEGERGRVLVPATPLDDETIKQLDPSVIYTTEFTKTRNYQYHKRYFAMLKVVLDAMDDDVRALKGITTMETLLLQVKLELGHCDYIWLDKYQQFCLTPKSISFASMDEFEFKEFYKKTWEVLLNYLPHSSVEDERNWYRYVDDAVQKLVGFM